MTVRSVMNIFDLNFGSPMMKKNTEMYDIYTNHL